MYPSKKYKMKVTTVIVGLSLLLTITACTPSKIQDRIDQTDAANEKIDKNTKPEDMNPEDIELSDSQLEIIDNLEGSVDSALQENDLEEMNEVEKNIPVAKKAYDNPEELSQYFAELTFLFNKMDMDSDLYQSKISPYFHESFFEFLPESDAGQRETFKILQEKFYENLPSEIVDYRITEVSYTPRKDEASVIRVYEMKNKEELHFITTMKFEDGNWWIANDKPSPPYKIKTYKDK